MHHASQGTPVQWKISGNATFHKEMPRELVLRLLHILNQRSNAVNPKVRHESGCGFGSALGGQRASANGL